MALNMGLGELWVEFVAHGKEDLDEAIDSSVEHTDAATEQGQRLGEAMTESVTESKQALRDLGTMLGATAHQLGLATSAAGRFSASIKGPPRRSQDTGSGSGGSGEKGSRHPEAASEPASTFPRGEMRAPAARPPRLRGTDAKTELPKGESVTLPPTTVHTSQPSTPATTIAPSEVELPRATESLLPPVTVGVGQPVTPGITVAPPAVTTPQVGDVHMAAPGVSVGVPHTPPVDVAAPDYRTTAPHGLTLPAPTVHAGRPEVPHGGTLPAPDYGLAESPALTLPTTPATEAPPHPTIRHRLPAGSLLGKPSDARMARPEPRGLLGRERPAPVATPASPPVPEYPPSTDVTLPGGTATLAPPTIATTPPPALAPVDVAAPPLRLGEMESGTFPPARIDVAPTGRPEPLTVAGPEVRTTTPTVRTTPPTSGPVDVSAYRPALPTKLPPVTPATAADAIPAWARPDALPTKLPVTGGRLLPTGDVGEAADARGEAPAPAASPLAPTRTLPTPGPVPGWAAPGATPTPLPTAGGRLVPLPTAPTLPAPPPAPAADPGERPVWDRPEIITTGPAPTLPRALPASRPALPAAAGTPVPSAAPASLPRALPAAGPGPTGAPSAATPTALPTAFPVTGPLVPGAPPPLPVATPAAVPTARPPLARPPTTPVAAPAMLPRALPTALPAGTLPPGTAVPRALPFARPAALPRAMMGLSSGPMGTTPPRPPVPPTAGPASPPGGGGVPPGGPTPPALTSSGGMSLDKVLDLGLNKPQQLVKVLDNLKGKLLLARGAGVDMAKAMSTAWDKLPKHLSEKLTKELTKVQKLLATGKVTEAEGAGLVRGVVGEVKGAGEKHHAEKKEKSEGDRFTAMAGMADTRGGRKRIEREARSETGRERVERFAGVDQGTAAFRESAKKMAEVFRIGGAPAKAFRADVLAINAAYERGSITLQQRNQALTGALDDAGKGMDVLKGKMAAARNVMAGLAVGLGALVRSGFAGTGMSEVLGIQFQLFSREIASLFIEQFDYAIRALSRMTDAMRMLTGEQQRALGRVLTFAAGVGLLARVLPTALTAMQGLWLLVRTNPFTAVALALAAAVASTEQGRDAFLSMAEAVAPLARVLMDAFATLVPMAVQFVQTLVPIIRWLADSFRTMVTWVAEQVRRFTGQGGSQEEQEGRARGEGDSSGIYAGLRRARALLSGRYNEERERESAQENRWRQLREQRPTVPGMDLPILRDLQNLLRPQQPGQQQGQAQGTGQGHQTLLNKSGGFEDVRATWRRFQEAAARQSTVQRREAHEQQMEAQATAQAEEAKRTRMLMERLVEGMSNNGPEWLRRLLQPGPAPIAG